VDSEPTSEGLVSQAKAIVATGLSALQNRVELFLLECEEEKAQVIELLVWSMVAGLLGIMFLALVTVLVIMAFPAEQRIWAVAGFCALYFIGAVLAFFNLRSLMRHSKPPFSASINELKKDHACLDSLK
jgi:uncharacterized membrane protein YqjE